MRLKEFWIISFFTILPILLGCEKVYAAIATQLQFDQSFAMHLSTGTATTLGVYHGLFNAGCIMFQSSTTCSFWVSSFNVTSWNSTCGYVNNSNGFSYGWVSVRNGTLTVNNGDWICQLWNGEIVVLSSSSFIRNMKQGVAP